MNLPCFRRSRFTLVADFYDGGKHIFFERKFDVPLTTTLKELVSQVKEEHQDLGNENFLVEYDHVFYEDATMESLNIPTGAELNLVPFTPKPNQNLEEGLLMVKWSVLTLVISLFLVCCVIFQPVSLKARTMLITIGFVVLIPSAAFFWLGLVELDTCASSHTVVGDFWFCRLGCIDSIFAMWEVVKNNQQEHMRLIPPEL